MKTRAEVESYLNMGPVELMAHHAKSFSFASFFFDKETLKEVAKLYQVCRFIDDVADTLNRSDALEILGELKASLLRLEDDESGYEQILLFLDGANIPRKYIVDLIDGALFDLNEKEISTEKELIDYCYHVAGVVGLMMCPLIGVEKKDARNGAIDLGIGMQLVNINRDVLEDARMGRMYLPKANLSVLGLNLSDLRDQGPAPKGLKEIIKRNLDYADEYFKSGYFTLNAIPLRSRFVILIAGRVYERIGKKIRRNNYEVLTGRTIVSKLEKFYVLVTSLRFLLKRSFWFAPKLNYKNSYPLLESLKTDKIRSVL